MARRFEIADWDVDELLAIADEIETALTVSLVPGAATARCCSPRRRAARLAHDEIPGG